MIWVIAWHAEIDKPHTACILIQTQQIIIMERKWM